MMTVVNYSVQETFGNNLFFWEGLGWFEKLLNSDRFHAALGRQFMFTGLILVIEVPLGIAIALAMPRQGIWVPFFLVTMALPMLIPWNVVGAMWNIFTLPDIGLLGYFMNHTLGIDYDMTQKSICRLGDDYHHGCLALDVAGGFAQLRWSGIDPGCLLSSREN